MQTRIALAPGADLPGFRAAVRGLVARGVKPREVLWETVSYTHLTLPTKRIV